MAVHYVKLQQKVMCTWIQKCLIRLECKRSYQNFQILEEFYVFARQDTYKTLQVLEKASNQL